MDNIPSYNELIQKIKKLEEKVENSNTILDDLKEWIIIFDCDGNITFVSDACKKITGYDKDDFIKDTDFFLKIVHLDDKELAENHFCQEDQKKTVTEHIECRIIAKDATIKWIDLYCNNLTNKEGKFYGRKAIIQDITEKKNLEKTLKEKEDKLISVIENAPGVAIQFYDKYGRITFWNKASTKIYGYSREESFGKTLDSLFLTKEDSEKFLQILENINKTGMSFGPITWTVITKNGDQKHVYSSTFKLSSSDPNEEFICMDVDITERVILENLIKKRQDRFRSLSENTPIPIGVSDLEGNILFINSAFTSVFGYQPADIPTIKDWMNKAYPNKNYRNTVFDIWNKDVNDFIQKRVSKAPTREYNITCHNGLVKEAEISFSFDGTNISVVIKDISVRKKAEAALIESESKYRMLFENSLLGISLAKLNGQIIEANQAMESILGYSHDELLKLNIRELYQDARKRDEIIAMLKNTESLRNVELELESKSGRLINVIANINIIERFGTKHIITSLIDISRRKKTEDFLKKNEEKLRLLIESFADIVFTLDTSERHTGIYGTWIHNFGLEEEDFIGKTHVDIMGDFGIVHSEANKRALKGETVIYEWQAIMGENMHHFQTILSPIYKENEIIGLNGVGRNISELKEAQKKLLEATEDLKEINATKDKFFSIIAHDLRNPFSHILGFTELLLSNYDDFDKSKTIEILEMIYQSSEKTFDLLENLLLWANSQKGTIVFSPEMIKLSEVINDVIEKYKGITIQKGIAVNFFMLEEQIVFADKNMLNTVLRNLLNNSIKYSHKGGNIDITVKMQKEQILLSIIDYGTGMEEETLKEIFRTSNQKSLPGTSNEKGTGLGLILCKEFVEKHGGKIWAESRLGEGSSFKFTLPIK
jgi:PAS domain S-box-containing protein